MELVNRPSKRQRSDNDASEENLPSSAKRTSRACDLCRAKKNKCDGLRPSCSACARGGLDCTYGTQAKKRGFPTGYVRVLEALWALVFAAIPAGEQTALMLLRDSAIGYDDDDKVILQNSHFDANESPRSIWEKSSVRAEIERMVSSLENPAGMDLRESQSTHKELSRPPAPLPTWNLRQASSSTEVATNTPSTGRAIISVPNDPEFRKSRSHLLNLSPEHVELDPNMQTGLSDPMSIVELHLESRPKFPIDSWALVDTYFRFNNCWLPIIQKHDVVRILSSSQEESEGSAQEVALLWAIFAIASAQSDPDRDMHLSGSNEERSQWYYRQASFAIPNQQAEFHREHVQALLLLSMVDMARDQWQAAYFLVGKAVRILLLWHTHFTNVTNPNLAAGTSPKEAACLLLATFALDTIIAAHLEVLPNLRAHDIENHLEFDENGAEEWSQWSTSNTANASQHHQPVRALSTFKAYTKLLAILNNTCCTIHSQTPESRRTQIDRCLRELETWKVLLPKHCKMDVLDTSSQTIRNYLPPAANLFITFEAVTAYIQALEGSCPLAVLTGQGVPAILKDCPAKRLYSDIFGQFKWDGILHFHRRMLLEAHRQHSSAQSARRQPFGTETQHLLGSEHLDLNFREQTGPIDQIGASSNLFSSASLQQSMDGDFTLLDPGIPHPMVAGTPDRSDRPNYDQLQIPLTLTLSGAEAPQDMSTEQATTREHVHTVNDAPFDGSFETDTIESLLEELSATQGSDWNEISSQFRYNLGFTNNDIGLP